MNYRAWLPLSLSLILGVLAAKAGHSMLVRGRQGAGQQIPTSPAVVLRHDVAAGVALRQEDLAVRQMPKDTQPRNAFGSPGEVVGRVVVVPLVKDQVVLDSLLAPTGVGSGPQSLLPQGMRAVTIDVNEVSGVAGLLSPGCRVDVVSTLQDAQAGHPVARTIVQNVKVMAVGRRTVPAKREDDEQPLARSVTLIVSPQEAEMVELASSSGRARLVLRGAMDLGANSSNGVTVAQMLGRRGQQANSELFAWLSSAPLRLEGPAAVATAQTPVKVGPAQPGRRTVEVISGTAISKVEVPLPQGLPATAATENGDGQ